MSTGQRRMRYAGRKTLIGVIVALVLGGLVAADRAGLFHLPGGSGGGARSGSESEQIARDLETFDGKSFRVVHVADGDTLSVEVPGEHAYAQAIRLLGVDTPETVKPGQPKPDYFGPEASAFTKKTATGQAVTLHLDPKRTRDIYNRLLAYVDLPGGRTLNLVLVQEGYGYADPRFTHPRKSEYEKAQKEARAAKRGLWKDWDPSKLPVAQQGKIK